MNMNSKSDCIGVSCTRLRHLRTRFNSWKKIPLHTWQKTNVVTNHKILLSLFYGSTTMCGGVYARCNCFAYHFAPNVPTESCIYTTGIPRYHQNPLYIHRILFALTACYMQLKKCNVITSVREIGHKMLVLTGTPPHSLWYNIDNAPFPIYLSLWLGVTMLFKRCLSDKKRVCQNQWKCIIPTPIPWYRDDAMRNYGLLSWAFHFIGIFTKYIEQNQQCTVRFGGGSSKMSSHWKHCSWSSFLNCNRKILRRK